MITTQNCCICEPSDLMQMAYDKFKRKHNQGQGPTPSAADRWKFLVAPSKRSDSLVLDTDYIDAKEQYPGTVDLDSLSQISVADGVDAVNTVGIPGISGNTLTVTPDAIGAGKRWATLQAAIEYAGANYISILKIKTGAYPSESLVVPSAIDIYAEAGVSGLTGFINQARVESTTLPAGPVYPIRIPEGVAVISFQFDDMLSQQYEVLYKECLKRGFPISLVVPSVHSNFTTYNLMDFSHMADVLLRGGGDFLHHSVSHNDWWPDDINWFKHEVSKGCTYGEGDTKINNASPTSTTAEYPERVRFPLGYVPADELPINILSSLIQSNADVEGEGRKLFLTDGIGGTHIQASGFYPPGEWVDKLEGLSVGPESEEYKVLTKVWGTASSLYGPNTYRYPVTISKDRYEISKINSGSSLKVFNDNLYQSILTSACINFKGHDLLSLDEPFWADDSGLFSGPDSNGLFRGTGSAPEGYFPYADAIPYQSLISLLNHVEELVEEGKAVVIPASAAMMHEKGSPINLLHPLAETTEYSTTLSDKRKMWGRYIKGTGSTYGNLKWVSENSELDFTNQYPCLSVKNNSTIDDSVSESCWYTTVSNIDSCDRFILTGRMSAVGSNIKAKIVIGGALAENTITNSNGILLMMGNNDIDANATPITDGSLVQPLYEYIYDGTELKDTPVGEWKYFQIPFCVPKPLKNVSIKFSSVQTAGGLEELLYSNLKLIPMGVRRGGL